MSTLLQAAAVGLIVAACALYCIWRLLSARLRLRALDLVGAVPGVGGSAWFAALRERTRAGLAGGCASCSSASTSAASRKQTPGALRR